MKTTKRLLSVMLVAALVFTVIPAATVQAAPAKVKVTFSANGGKIGTVAKKAVSVTKGKKIGKLPKAKRTGYALKGWYTAKSGGKKIKSSTKAVKKATYYARWTAKKYTLTFNPNGGTVDKKSQKATYRKAYGKLPTPKRSGYAFDGWYTAQTGGKKITSSTKVATAKSMTVYAQWKRSLNSEEQKLVGTWGIYWDGNTVYRFYPDGTYIMYAHWTMFSDMRARGFWSIDNGMLTRVAQWGTQTNKDTDGYIADWGYLWTPWGDWETTVYKVRFGIDHNSFEGQQCVDIYQDDSNFSLQTQRYIKDRVGSIPW